MELTAQEFATLMRDLKCDFRPGERRHNPRAPARAKVQIIPIKDERKAPKRQSIWVRDLSRTGFGLSSSLKLEEGSRLLILLPKNTCEAFVLLCEVVRSVRMMGNTFNMGVKLVRRVSSNEYDAFLGGVPNIISTMLKAA